MTSSELLNRIRHLEAENASLGCAAEEAAQLAEEYASDAAKWRSRAANQEQSMVNELGDAARRKDRRIQRLSSLLEAERVKRISAENRSKELEELSILSAEMEETLHTSIRMLQSKLRKAPPASEIKSNNKKSSMSQHQLFLRAVKGKTAHSILEVMQAYFPQDSDLRGDITTFSVLLRLSYLQESVLYLMDTTDSMDEEEPFQSIKKLLSNVKESITRAQAWCLEDPAEIPFRGRKIVREVVSLEERVGEFFTEYVSSTESLSWPIEAGKMIFDLVRMSMDSLNSMIPGEAKPANIEDTNQPLSISEAIVERGKVVASNLDDLTRQEQISNSEAILQSKLNAAQTLLSRRERELEDMRIRTRVFEERLDNTAEDAKVFNAQSVKVLALEAELEHVRQSLNVERESEVESNHSVDMAPVEKKSIEPIDQPRSDLNRREYRLLQLAMAKRHLIDLTPVPTPTVEERVELEKEVALHDTILATMSDARKAASNARALRLDPKTLQPMTRGATLSRKGLIQAAALVRRETNKKVTELHDYRSPVKCEMRFNSSQNLASMIRLSRSGHWL